MQIDCLIGPHTLLENGCSYASNEVPFYTLFNSHADKYEDNQASAVFFRFGTTLTIQVP